MFNGHFYEEGGEEACREFLHSSDSSVVAIVIDPPFGGLAQVLARQVRQLWSTAGGGESNHSALSQAVLVESLGLCHSHCYG